MLPLVLGGLVSTVIMLLVLVYVLTAWWSTPIFGLGAGGPDQPIAFPHNVHVEEFGIPCEFCHRNVVAGDAATVPAVEQCLICHATVNGEAEVEIAKLLEYAGRDATGKIDPEATPQPIDWERVHRIPDHVQFAHEPHVRHFSQQQNVIDLAIANGRSPVEQVCTMCHGEVREMTKVKQERSLKMGDCVDCHRDNDAPTDCTTCHY
jgi:hypothetical protein